MTRVPPAWRAAALYAAVLILLALPIWSVVVPPLGDYTNHLARMHILATIADSPALQANYVVAWKLTPYLGMDLIVPPMVRLMSIYTAGRAFLCLCLLLFVAGTCAIHAALYRRFAAWPAASALFCYSFVFSLGFVNYLFGVGIWLLAFAGWIVLSRRTAVWRVALGTLLSFAVFFSHYFAFFGYMLCVGTYELGVWWQARQWSIVDLPRRGAIAFCQFVPPLALFVWASRDQGRFGTVYGSPTEKLTALLSPIAFPGARFDLATLAFALAVLLGGLLTKRIRIAPVMLPLLAAMFAAAAAMPNILSGVWGIDYRLPVVCVFLAIAACEWRAPPGRLSTALTAAMLLLLAVNLASIIHAWRPIGQQYDELRAAVAVLPRGAHVIAYREDEGVDPALRPMPLYVYAQMPTLAVIERDAYVPFVFKHPMMELAAAPGLAAIDTPHGHPVEYPDFIAGMDPVRGPAMLGAVDGEGRHNYWGDWPHHYDYAIELNFGAHPTEPALLQPLRRGQIFTIYAIRH